MKTKLLILIALGCSANMALAQNNTETPMMKKVEVGEQPKKAVVYQVFTRLFGNKNTTLD